jgi:cytochrome c1
MKKKVFLLVIMLICSIQFFISSCSTSKLITEKSGAQLWGENCNRCHNAPSSDQYAKAQWDVIGMHMKVRANFTDQELTKIVKYLKGEE